MAWAVVFEAEQREPIRRRVALKVIKAGMDTRQVVDRFQAERQALAVMDHPNLAKVFEGGSTEEGRPFFVMDWSRAFPSLNTATLITSEHEGLGPLFVTVNVLRMTRNERHAQFL